MYLLCVQLISEPVWSRVVVYLLCVQFVSECLRVVSSRCVWMQVWLRNELALLSGGSQVEITVDEDAAAGDMVRIHCLLLLGRW